MLQAQDINDSKFIYGAVLALPILLGGVIVIWWDGVSASGVFASLFLVCFGIACGLLLWRRHVDELKQTNIHWQQDESSKMDAVAAYTTELERLLLRISPMLSQHVMVSREHTEEEIVSLTNRFAGMVTELQQIVESTDNTLGGQDYHLENVMNTSRNLLQPVLESLRHIHQLEYSAMDELRKLSGQMAELGSVASGVRNLTGQIDSLAVSAANEHGFAVEARKLADNALQIDQRLGDKVNEIGTVINAALIISESSVQSHNSILVQAETHINQTLSLLGQALTNYRDNVDALRNNADQIHTEIDNVLVALQFQDRVSQILTQVENNLLNLQKTIEKIQQQGVNRDGDMLQVDEALDHIEENYRSVTLRSSRVSDSSDDLTFF